MTTPTLTPRASDVTLTCPCCGAVRRIRAASDRYLRGLTSPGYEAEVHRLANGRRQ